jgi:hypothetical protein
MIAVAAVALLVVGATPAAAKRDKPPPPDNDPVLTLKLTCHMEAGGEIPAPHLDAESTWTDLGNGRYKLVVIIPPQDPTHPEPPEAGHTKTIQRSPSGSDLHHMDFWVETGTTYIGEAYIETRKGTVVATAADEVHC